MVDAGGVVVDGETVQFLFQIGRVPEGRLIRELPSHSSD